MKSYIKNAVIASGMYNYYRCYAKYNYFLYLLDCGDIDTINIDYLPYADFVWYSKKYPRLWYYASLLYNAHRKKSQRLRYRFSNMFACCSGVLFLTLTFSDDVLLSTSQDTRRQYVRKFLKRYNVPYVANIDFGDQYGREHYHAVIGCDYVDPKLWKYGAINFERVSNFVSDKDKIAEYINKLTHHSTKDSAGHLIYSRMDKSKGVATDVGFQFVLGV